MKPVTRLFFISTGWTLAMYSASNFIGAWFWDIGTGILPILLFYTILFVVMVLSFASASKIRRRLSSARMMTLGIILNAIYLALLLILKTKTRQYYIPLAMLDGLSSSFYWLSLFVLAASWVKSGQAAWYNSWTGTIEAILGLVAPPLSGWIIQAVPGLNGYRVVFFVAFLSLLACAWLVLSQRQLEVSTGAPVLASEGRHLPVIPGWRRLVTSFGVLGLRDGMYFFVPSLILYIVTRSTILLGLFNAMQAAIEGVVFWALTRAHGPLAGRMGLVLATGVSLLALGLLWVPLGTGVLFLLGAIIAVSYPAFKVALESSALALITQNSRDDEDRTQLTGIKEVWINSGRLVSLVFLLILLASLGPLHIPDFRWILGLWAFVPLILYALSRNIRSVLSDFS